MKETDRMPFIQPIGSDGKPIVFIPYDFSNWKSDRIKKINNMSYQNRMPFSGLDKKVKFYPQGYPYSESLNNTRMPHIQTYHEEISKPKYGFVSTSDGRIGFLSEDYKSHTSGTDHTKASMYWVKVKMKDKNEPELFVEYKTEEEREIALQEMCDILHVNKNN